MYKSEAKHLKEQLVVYTTCTSEALKILESWTRCLDKIHVHMCVCTWMVPQCQFVCLFAGPALHHGHGVGVFWSKLGSGSEGASVCQQKGTHAPHMMHILVTTPPPPQLNDPVMLSKVKCLGLGLHLTLLLSAGDLCTQQGSNVQNDPQRHSIQVRTCTCTCTCITHALYMHMHMHMHMYHTCTVHAHAHAHVSHMHCTCTCTCITHALYMHMHMYHTCTVHAHAHVSHMHCTCTSSVLSHGSSFWLVPLWC